MDAGDDGKDTRSEATSTSGFTAHTPASDVDRFRYRPLSSGSKFLILERASNKAITIADDGALRLKDMLAAKSADNQWLCVERNGYLGLLHSRSGRYIGHDGNGRMQALATRFNAWECITTRDQPGGGYKLLVPHWWEALKTIVVAEDGESLVTRDHGDTLWDFINVSGSEEGAFGDGRGM